MPEQQGPAQEHESPAILEFALVTTVPSYAQTGKHPEQTKNCSAFSVRHTGTKTQGETFNLNFRSTFQKIDNQGLQLLIIALFVPTKFFQGRGMGWVKAVVERPIATLTSGSPRVQAPVCI